MNQVAINILGHMRLLELFPAVYHEKLRVFTCEELFYNYKLVTFVPGKTKEGEVKPGDILFAVLRNKTLDYLNGKSNKPVHHNAWLKLNKRWKPEWESYWQDITDEYGEYDPEDAAILSNHPEL